MGNVALHKNTLKRRKHKRGGGLSPLNPAPKIVMPQNIHKKIKTLKKFRNLGKKPIKNTNLHIKTLIKETKKLYKKTGIKPSRNLIFLK